MNVLGIYSSPRKAATEYALQEALCIAGEYEGTTTSFVSLGLLGIRPCLHCDQCLKEGLFHCPMYPDDPMRELCEQVQKADVLILASPVYQMAPSPQMLTFINRLRPLGKLTSQGGWSTKVGVSIAVGGKRNGGEESVLDILNRFFLCQGMCLAGGGVYTYNGAAIWSQNTREGAQQDDVGLKTLSVSVRRAMIMATLLQSGLKQSPEFTGPQLAGFRDEEERNAYVSAFRK